MIAPLTPLACALSLLVAQTPSQSLSLDWDNNMLTISSSAIPGGKVEIWHLEAFCRKGSTARDWNETVIPHTTVRLDDRADSRSVRLRSDIGSGVQADQTIRAGVDDVTFEVALTNLTDTDIDIEWAQPCIRVGEFTGLDQEEYIKRCFIFTESGVTMLDKTRRTTEARYRGGQVYVPGGILLDDVNPRPISPDVPKYPIIGCVSSDGKWVLATAWDSTQELFQGVIKCIHADFRIGGLRPRESKRVYGKLYILPNDPAALLKRFLRDFTK